MITNDNTPVLMFCLDSGMSLDELKRLRELEGLYSLTEDQEKERDALLEKKASEDSGTNNKQWQTITFNGTAENPAYIKSHNETIAKSVIIADDKIETSNSVNSFTVEVVSNSPTFVNMLLSIVDYLYLKNDNVARCRYFSPNSVAVDGRITNISRSQVEGNTEQAVKISIERGDIAKRLSPDKDNDSNKSEKEIQKKKEEETPSLVEDPTTIFNAG